MVTTVRLYYDAVIAVALMAVVAIICGFVAVRDHRWKPAELPRRRNRVCTHWRGLVFPPLAQLATACASARLTRADAWPRHRGTSKPSSE